MMELSEIAKIEMRRLVGSAWAFTPLPDALFAELAVNPVLRNAIATANQQVRQPDFQPVAWIAHVYPHRYAVSPEQIEAAKAQWDADKQAAIDRLTDSSTLLMVDMGALQYTPADSDEIPSYRLRGCFQTPNGRQFMLEVSHSNKENSVTGPMYCSEFVDLDLDLEQQQAARPRGEDYRWIKNADLGAYTKTNLLRLINRHFECHFTTIEIDHYTLAAKDYISISPASSVRSVLSYD